MITTILLTVPPPPVQPSVPLPFGLTLLLMFTAVMIFINWQKKKAR